jgi:ketosteroid isomerase-like protein
LSRTYDLTPEQEASNEEKRMSSPEDAVRAYFRAINESDADEIADVFTDDGCRNGR